MKKFLMMVIFCFAGTVGVAQAATAPEGLTEEFEDFFQIKFGEVFNVGDDFEATEFDRRAELQSLKEARNEGRSALVRPKRSEFSSGAAYRTALRAHKASQRAVDKVYNQGLKQLQKENAYVRTLKLCFTRNQGCAKNISNF